MSTRFEWFKDERTGKVEKYPARFAGRPGLVRVDEGHCTDCGGHDEAEEPQTVIEPDEDTQEFYVTGWPDESKDN